MLNKDLDRIVGALENAHQETIMGSNLPADTVAAFVAAVGYDTARQCIASMVRRVSWDGRISRAAKEWAASSPLDEDWCRMSERGRVYSDKIHQAHLSQLAEAMAAFVPQEEPEKEEAAPDTIQDIYAAAVAILPASDIDHHATDLYLRKSPLTDALVDHYHFRCNVTKFRAADGSGVWYDVPFAYTPAWAERLDAMNEMCPDCSQLGHTCRGTTETVWGGCIYRNTDTPPVPGPRRRPPADSKAVADAKAVAELNASLRGLWSNLRFEHADAAGWWYSYDLQGQGRQVLRVTVPADCAAEGGAF